MHTNRFQSISQSKALVLLIASATHPLILQPDSIHPPSYFYLLTLFSLEKGNHTPSQKYIWKKKRKKFWRAIYSQFHQNSTFAWRHTKKSETLLFSNIYSKWDCLFGLNKMLWSAICTFCQKMTDDAKHTSTLRRFAIKGESSCLFT